MKYISKGGEPSALRKWREGQRVENGRCINCSFKDMPRDVKENVKQKLLQEQGYLCCYTGLAIEAASSHIEHLKPQERCEAGEDIDYGNLVAAYPGNRPGDPKPRCEYGAVAKDNWYDANLFVSPLRGDCEQRFSFTQFGEIKATDAGDEAAVATIQRLCLDHKELTELRRNVLYRILIKNKRSQKQLEAIAKDYGKKDGDGRYRSFCFVIQKVAQTLATRKQKNSEAHQRQNKAGDDKQKRS